MKKLLLCALVLSMPLIGMDGDMGILNPNEQQNIKAAGPVIKNKEPIKNDPSSPWYQRAWNWIKEKYQAYEAMIVSMTFLTLYSAMGYGLWKKLERGGYHTPYPNRR